MCGELAVKRPRARKPATPKEPVEFTKDGKKTAAAPKDWPFGTRDPQPEPEAPPAAVDPANDEPEISADTPLEFLLAVVRAKNLKLPLRMQAAAIAAPFVHAKPAPAGKKEAKTEAAKGVGGKFAAQAPPLKLVNR